jgi:hypothetical protein
MPEDDRVYLSICDAADGFVQDGKQDRIGGIGISDAEPV